MAPQNSTLIHEDGDCCTEELTRCFIPISPLIATMTDVKTTQQDDDGSNGGRNRKRDSCYTSASDSGSSQPQSKKSIYCRAIKHTQEEDDFEDDEIPIWICGEPRYVSGITPTTTCTDVIQALIDDEISNTMSNVAASRDVNDYMIAERWRDVEQILPAETCVLPLWQAWDVARNEVKFRLKINKNASKQDHHDDANNSKHDKIHFLMKILRKILKQRRSIDQQLIECKTQHFMMDGVDDDYDDSFVNFPKNNLIRHTHAQLAAIETNTEPIGHGNVNTARENNSEFYNQIRNTDDDDDDDELFLVIENNYDDGDSGVHVEGRTIHEQTIFQQQKAISSAAHNNHHKPQPQKLPANNLFEINHTSDDELPSSCKFPPSSSMNRSRGTNNNQVDGFKVSAAIPTTKRKVSTTTNFDSDLWRKCKLNRSNKLLQPHMGGNYGEGRVREPPKTRYELIQNEIMLKIYEIRVLIERERQLSEMLDYKCAQYRAENEMYMGKVGLEMSIDRVQENLEMYTREIIQNEQELLNIKMEILSKTKKLDHLKHILELERPKKLKERAKAIAPRTLKYEEEFVDSFTGVFDKNESLIV